MWGGRKRESAAQLQARLTATELGAARCRQTRLLLSSFIPRARYLCAERGSVHGDTVAVWPENPFSLLLTRPQGPQGCQMKRNHSLNMPLEVWCAKIDPKLNKLEKTIKIEKKLVKNVCFLKVF